MLLSILLSRYADADAFAALLFYALMAFAAPIFSAMSCHALRAAMMPPMLIRRHYY